MAKQLKIVEVTQSGPYSLRVRFGGLDNNPALINHDFVAVPYLNADNQFNALRTDIYTVSGNTTLTVQSVTTVQDHFDCVDVTTVDQLQASTYTLTVDTTGKNPVKDWHGYELKNLDASVEGETCYPYQYTVPNILCRVLTPVPQQETIEKLVRKYLSPILDGPNFRSLIASLVVGEKYNADNSQAALRQLFVNTASTPYLERLGANYGIYQQQGKEMDDDHFRRYIQTFYNKKLTEDSLYSMIEVFYGRTSTRAHARSRMGSGTSPVAQVIGAPEDSTMTILFDGFREVTITFFADEFTEATNANAAMLIDRKLREQKVPAFCDMDNNGQIRLFSNTKGLRSSVEITDCPSWLPFDTDVKNTLYSNPNPAYIGRDNQGVLQIFLPTLASLSMGRSSVNATYDQSGSLVDESQLYYPTAKRAFTTADIPVGTVSSITVESTSNSLPATVAGKTSYLFIGYGWDHSQGPVSYTLTENTITLSASLSVTKLIPAGTEINEAVKTSGDVYVDTDAQNAVNMLVDTLKQMLAAGEKYQINVVIP